MSAGTLGAQEAVPPNSTRGARFRRPSVRLLLLMPAIVYLAVLTQAPFVVTLWYSIHKWILDQPELGKPLVGLDTFRYEITQDTVFQQAVLTTLTITVLILATCLILGLGFALLLNRRFPGRGVIRALMIAPFFVMPTVNAVVWKNFLFDPITGIFDWILTSLHFSRVDFLTNYPKLSIVAIASWQWTPFMMLILLAGLQGMSEEVREAARLDGASGLGEFRYITLPLLARYIELCILLGTIYVLNLFGEIRVATAGGPGTQTTTVPYYVYQTIHDYNDVGSAAALGVLAVIFASIIAAGLLRLLIRTFREGMG